MNFRLIAEIGSVHDGSFGNACKLIEAAAAAGADAVKFQTHIAEAETLAHAPAPAYFKAEPRMAYFKRTGFSRDQWKELAQVAKAAQVVFLSSPFSLEAVDLLESIGMAAYKIPSGEVSNVPLLEHVASTGKPVLLSSGMSDWKDLDRAVRTLRKSPLTVMQCSSMYPCPPEHVGLNVLGEMAKRYRVPVGYSDHTLGSAAAIAAVAMGATVVEKHFTFSRLMYGSDAKHSMEPNDFKALAQSLNDVWTMLAHPVDKSDTRAYREMKKIFQKSIVTRRALPAGCVLKKTDLAYKKPGDGIPAADYQTILGKRLKRAVPENYPLKRGDLK